jgi:hypothetical protein
MTDPGTDHTFTDVPVAAGILHATADLIDVLGDFLNHTDPTILTQLGAYLISHHDVDTTRDPALAAAITLAELDEAADLLHTLADSAGHTS